MSYLASTYTLIDAHTRVTHVHIYHDLNLFSPYTDITGKGRWIFAYFPPLHAAAFLLQEFDISLGSTVVGVRTVGDACGCDRSTAATEESIRGGSCRTG